MKALPDLIPIPELQPVEPFNGPVKDHRTRATNSDDLLHALGGPAVVLKVAGDEDDAWDPSADEDFGGFDIHLGVYASD
jgi:hypothetical protein